MLSAIILVRLIEFLGIICRAVVSSALNFRLVPSRYLNFNFIGTNRYILNFVINLQSIRRLFVTTENNITPSFVPCGIPAFGHFQSDSQGRRYGGGGGGGGSKWN